MVYALWDTDSHNLVAEYESIEDALGLVLRGIERNGPGDTESLALERENDRGQVIIIARGQELASLARRQLSDNNRMAR